MKRLCIGIIDLTTGWKVILDQIGVWYEQLQFDSELSNNYSVIIVNKSISETQEDLLHLFNEKGGSILETQKGETFSYARYTVTKKVTHLDNPNHIPFLSHISTLDIHTKAELYNGFDNFDGIIDFEKHGKGFVCNLGINPDELMENNSFSRKRFPFKSSKHPDELVSNVSKSELIQVLTQLLKELHFQQGIPFVNKWTSPTPKPVFLFRIDSDFGDEQSIRKFYDLANAQNVPITWFLHVKAHEDWLHIFKEFKNQEIALHGYEHGTSNSYETIYNNIEKGLQLLKDAEYNPKGFCVPYAIWSDPLAEVLSKFEFEYSSEFTIGYDGLPFYPIHNGEQMDTLQIPIHPICTGSLSRKKITINEMKEYFFGVMDRKLAKQEPVIFYHHPMQIGIEVWKDIFKKVNELGLTTMSFLQYSEFWKTRLNAKVEAFLDTNTNKITLSGDATNSFIQVSKSHSEFELVKKNHEENTQYSEKFRCHKVHSIDTSTLKELRSGKLTLIKTSLIDQKNRIKL